MAITKSIVLGAVAAANNAADHALNVVDQGIADANAVGTKAIQVGDQTAVAAVAAVRKLKAELDAAVNDLVNALPLP